MPHEGSPSEHEPKPPASERSKIAFHALALRLARGKEEALYELPDGKRISVRVSDSKDSIIPLAWVNLYEPLPHEKTKVLEFELLADRRCLRDIRMIDNREDREAFETLREISKDPQLTERFLEGVGRGAKEQTPKEREKEEEIAELSESMSPVTEEELFEFNRLLFEILKEKPMEPGSKT